MSGIEAAGLVLGIFPLLIEGINFYRRATVNLSRKRLVRELKIEKVLFDQTCENHLHVLVDDNLLSEDTVKSLLAGSGWDEHILQLLEDRMGETAARLFIEGVAGLHKALLELGKGLGLSEDNKPGSLKHVLYRWDDIKLVFKKGQLLEDIKKTNAELHKLGKVRRRNSTSTSARAPFAANYNRIKRHASSLYTYMCHKFHTDPVCDCGFHEVNLFLGQAEVNYVARLPLPTLKFTLLFFTTAAKQRSSRKVVFESAEGCDDIVGIDVRTARRTGLVVPNKIMNAGKQCVRRGDNLAVVSQPQSLLGREVCRSEDLITDVAPRKPKKQLRFAPDDTSHGREKAVDGLIPIEDICSAIANPALQNQQDLGIVLLGDGLQHRVLLPRTPSSPYFPRPSTGTKLQPTRTVSLDGLLKRGLELRDRMKISVVLASAILQLHDTEWFKSGWGKHHIHFRLDENHKSLATDGNWYHDPIVDAPLVRQSFPLPSKETPGTQPEYEEPPPYMSDPSLFCLGVLLLEVWFQETFESLEQKTGVVGKYRDTNTTQYVAAQELLKEIDADEVGQTHLFGQAVRRCFRGLDCNSTDLSKDDFKNEAHYKIVRELERYWKACDEREEMSVS